MPAVCLHWMGSVHLRLSSVAVDNNTMEMSRKRVVDDTEVVR